VVGFFIDAWQTGWFYHDGSFPILEVCMAEFFDEAAKKPLLTYVPRWIHPNYLSVLRALLAVPVVLLKDIPALSISLLVLSSIFDLLDGPLARVRSQKSNLGA
jgi:hypothetical protein